MNTQTTRSILYPIIGLFLILTFSIGCEQTCYDDEMNQDEEDVDCGGPCIPCDSIILPPDPPTCFDGILNQDETDIDCGGVCPPCSNDTVPPVVNHLCTGDSSSTLLPLTIGNYWQYVVSNGQWFNLTITESVSLLGNNYFKMETGGQFGPIIDYFRVDGDYYVAAGTLAIGPNEGGQVIYRLTQNGELDPSFVAAHGSAACVTDASAALALHRGQRYPPAKICDPFHYISQPTGGASQQGIIQDGSVADMGR